MEFAVVTACSAVCSAADLGGVVGPAARGGALPGDGDVWRPSMQARTVAASPTGGD
jgi:hypothetical protein